MSNEKKLRKQIKKLNKELERVIETECKSIEESSLRIDLKREETEKLQKKIEKKLGISHKKTLKTIYIYSVIDANNELEMRCTERVVKADENRFYGLDKNKGRVGRYIKGTIYDSIPRVELPYVEDEEFCLPIRVVYQLILEEKDDYYAYQRFLDYISDRRKDLEKQEKQLSIFEDFIVNEYEEGEKNKVKEDMAKALKEKEARNSVAEKSVATKPVVKKRVPKKTE